MSTRTPRKSRPKCFTCEGSIGTGGIRCDDESGASGSLMSRARRERTFFPPSAFTRWMAVVRAPIGVACDFEPAPRALSSTFQQQIERPKVAPRRAILV